MTGTTKTGRATVAGEEIVLSLGGNLGRRFETLQAAVDALVDTPSVWIVAVSPVYESTPFGGPPGAEGSRDLSDQPGFLNTVLLGRTELSPENLLSRAMAIEDALGRVRTDHWEPRPIDVDLVAYGELVQPDPALTLPHPRAHQRAFVLVPWRDLDPAAHLPGHGPVADLIDGLTYDDMVRRDDLVLQL
jgi:2-amino-4-hydroxy-6-hydroxymethyldihydropteridine diphosphokinase